MIRNIIWKGIASESMEFCRIHISEGISIRSTIVGCTADVPYKADYEITLSKDWIISGFQIRTWLGNSEQSLHLQHNGHGKWTGNGREWQHLDGCMDIDISLTPFTNSLPVNRLRPASGVVTPVDVVYVDVLRFGISRETQYYTQKEAHQYQFANRDRSFHAAISFDSMNLVTFYTGLFKRLLARD